MTERSAQPESRTIFWAIIIPLIFIELNSSFEGAMLISSLPVLSRTFGNISDLGWILTANALAAAASCAFCARLAESVGRRTMLTVIPLLCAGGSMVSAHATSIWGVMIGSAIQGLTSGMLPIAFSVAREHLSIKKAEQGVGLITSSLSIGSGLGLFAGGVIIDQLGWQAIFYFSAALALAGSITARFALPRDRHLVPVPSSKKDLLIGSIFVPAIAMLIIGVTGLGRWGWTDQRTWLLSVAGLALLACWWLHQSRQTSPLINVRLFKGVKVRAAFICMIGLAIGPMQFHQVIPMFLQQPVGLGGFGLTSTASGALLLPALWMGVASAALSGWVASRRSAAFSALLGLGILSLGWALISVEHFSVIALVLLLTVAQFGLFFAYAALPNLVLEEVPVENTAELASILSVIRAVFAAAGAQIVAALLSSGQASDGAGHLVPGPQAFTNSFLFFALLPLIGIGILLSRSATRPSARHHPAPARGGEVIGHAE